MRVLNSCSWKRSDAPAQCTVEPPTAFTIQAGRLGNVLAIGHGPVACRLSFQASWANESHSSLTKSKVSSPVARLEDDGVDALERELGPEGPAAGARADDDEDGAVAEVVGS